VTKLAETSKAIQKSLSFVDLFEDFSGLGLSLEGKDLHSVEEVYAKLRKTQLSPSEEEAARFKQFIESPRGGGGVAKCHPLSVIQSNFTAYHLKL